ncbi:uncharacterized protein LOC101234500 isoform X1 [Hydra vulgaris]|uniref:uncharacterized protein LOC101234500 isoform X1 n=1 Tax=Hydra vulgaris TaxID=6087 RepID=UPI000640EC73|nr:uncharacterized protein LOC101234500 [Hydra vulgaris]XP_047123209.1 uncharacterized protein LOC101234500 [Hydra vulgaris]XP_047123210.1 uncharacterized protein LOC101234500 [Hydra vulgaris]XP_047123211.1 uncharacterized protein LOC101234500 [Hydra vulgaris]
MSKDKEMLLNLDHGSDSEEAIEEFKLPPPRKNQSKVRKNRKQLDTRVASGKSPLFTLKCIAVLVLISVVVSGCLLLAFFILNTQTQINDLKVSLAKANEKINSHTIEQAKSNEMLYMDIQNVKNSINNIQQQDFAILEKIKIIEFNQNSSKDKNFDNRKIEVMLNDISALKKGMADAGSETSKLQNKLSENQNLMEQVLKNVDDIKQKQNGDNVVSSTGELVEANKDFITRKELDSITSDHKLLNSKFEELAEEIRKYTQTSANHTESTKNRDIDNVSMKFIYELNIVKSLTDSLNISMNKKLSEIDDFVQALSNTSNSQFTSLHNDVNRVWLENINRGKLLQYEISQNLIILNNLTLEMKNVKGVLEKFNLVNNKKLLTPASLSPEFFPLTRESLIPESIPTTHDFLLTTLSPSLGNISNTASGDIQITSSNSSIGSNMEHALENNQSGINGPTSERTVTDPITSNGQLSNSSDALKQTDRPGFLLPFAPQEPGHLPIDNV